MTNSLLHREPPTLTRSFELVRKLSTPLAGAERARTSIKDVKLGGFLRYHGVLMYVSKVAAYTEVDEETQSPLASVVTELELTDVISGEKVRIEWEEDDEVEIFVTEEKASMRSLRDSEGQPISDPDDYAEHGECVVYSGKNFVYDDDWPVQYTPGDGRPDERAHVYEFLLEDDTCLTIEEWKSGSREEFEVYLSSPVFEDAIEVVQIGA